ncbi:MAG: CHRD domain-containing protein, partial [Aliifodinibius sp.]|nr:CHRD domain-containing protein [Fodinibius sp.]NIV12015.1 CHRD domain-containing protein [Fodinibius sp.]NIY25660.1 CHRD domain-containing protein [Fodinibius sp.]
MTRGTGTVWSKAVQLTAGTHEYKYAVMHQWNAAYGDGGVGGGFPNYSVNIPADGIYFFAFDDADNSQSVTPASVPFVAYLDGDQEVPPVTTTGTGMGTFALNGDSTMLMYEITIQNLTGNIVASHFHNAPAGTNGGVVKTIFSGSAGTDTTFSGIWTSSDSEPLTPALVHELLAGNLYINVHTDQFPPGEIRGQVFPQAAKLLISEFVVTP